MRCQFRPDEPNSLIEACASHLKPLVTFMLYTCTCTFEALYLDWRKVERSRTHVTFINDGRRGLRTKTVMSRGVSLRLRVVPSLANLPHRKGEVFRCLDGLPHVRRDKDDGGG